MQIDLATPALLFSTISLLLLAYTNRFLALASIIRKLHEDWFPTLLDLTGSSKALPEGLDGISILPTLLGKKQEPRPFLYREFHGYGGQQAVRAGDWKLVKRKLLGTKKKPANPTTELYHLATDPSEKHDVAASNPEIVQRLEKIAAAQHSASREFPFPTLDQK